MEIYSKCHFILLFPFSSTAVLILTNMSANQLGCLSQYLLTRRHSPKANELLNIAAIEER